MAEAANHPRSVERAATWWTLVLAIALGLRVVAAFAVTRYAEVKGKPCVFGDTAIYWELARAIAAGDPYLVMQWGVPHYALRTPGYPLFLAACRASFGANLLAVRLVQAVLGTLAVWLVARLARSVLAEGKTARVAVPLAAAAIAAIDPYIVGMSALVLSEATFLPLMLLGLWGLASLWRDPGPKRSGWLAVGTGLAMGMAILSRPSWALFVPLALASWVMGSGRGMRRRAFQGSLVVALATAAILAPWWARNGRVIGKFVPTALWVGASLYDGIGPQATGASDMAFVDEPDVRSLGEVEQDAVFRERSTSFAKGHPSRVFELAVIKFGRFWSPWPNADTLQAPGVAAASALATVPVLLLIALGAWELRRDFRAMVLLAGPLLYFCVLHVVFVSSIRYRIPGEVPALALAGVGLARAWSWARPRLSDGRPAREGFLMGFRRRLRKAIGWGSVLALAILVGGTISAYFFVTDSNTLADLIRRESPKFLPGCRVDATKVRLRPFWGELTLHAFEVRELGGDSPGSMVASSQKIIVRFDPWAMLKGRFEPGVVTLVKPRLRLRRRPDGSWNVQGLLADPWPIPKGGPTPPIEIQEGTVELTEAGSVEPLILLDKVSIKVPASTGSSVPIPFELTAKGGTGLFDRMGVRGTIDPVNGRLALKDGELVRFSLSEAYRDRLPSEVRDWLARAGLANGEVDFDLPSLSFDPRATPRFHYHTVAKLRRGLWKCSKLPFPISDVTVNVEAKDGELTILEAHGNDGPTSLGLTGRATLNPGDPARSTFRVVAEADDLQLDHRLRDWLPDPKLREVWDAYFPNVAATPSTSAGRISVEAVLGRASAGAELDYSADVKCLDVSMKYKHFAYPIDHIKGKIHATRKAMDLDVRTTVNDKPVRMTGKVANPGPDAVADLTFQVESLPIDAALFNALPPEVKPVVASFKPSGTVAGTATLHRDPPSKKGDDPRGRVEFHAWVDLNPGCSVTWKDLTYPVRNLTGKLEIHPDRWIFRDMNGNNGQATISVNGQVEQLNTTKPKVGPDSLKVHVQLKARNLPFDQQLRDALPTPWKVTWGTLNPSGASDIDATIDVDPRKPLPEREHYRIVIVPRKATGVKLRFNPLVGPGAPAVPGEIELRMDDVAGKFVYDTSDLPHTSMTGVQFTFQRAPVTFTRGVVDVRDNGQFKLDVKELEVRDLRLDDELRRYMPPVMANFSRRLDDMKITKIKANLGLGWSGKAGESASCKWDNALVVLYNNKISIGSDFGLEHIQGELNQVAGSFDGRDLRVKGKVDLASVDVFGQQISLTADLDIERSLARLVDIKGKVLGGALHGHLTATLETSPDYSVRLDLKQADLKDYDRSQPGHQSFRGLVDARVELSGFGYDPHTITGNGMARIVQGDLGTLPVALRFVNVLLKSASLSKKETKTAFDKAEVAFRVHNGETTLDPVRLVGNAFTLDGSGTLDVRGEIDLKLSILPGRDSLRIPVLSDITRGLSGQILVVRVHGPVGSPNIKPEPIPLPGEAWKYYTRKREIKKTGMVYPWRTGLESLRHDGIARRWFNPDQ